MRKTWNKTDSVLLYAINGDEKREIYIPFEHENVVEKIEYHWDWLKKRESFVYIDEHGGVIDGSKIYPRSRMITVIELEWLLERLKARGII